MGIEELAGVPISGAIGDQPAALFGQGCFEKGQAKNTYGTGCFLLMNTGDTAIKSKRGLICTLGACVEGESVPYVTEGSVFMGGAVIQWLRDEMRMLEKSSDSEAIALSVPNTEGVYIVPAFVGLGAPYWDSNARGVVCGLTRGANRAHFVRAGLESIAYQTYDVLKAMEDDLGVRVKELKVDGGACANNFLMQFQSDISTTAVQKSGETEATALGAAFLAGLSTGFWKDRDELRTLCSISDTYFPSMTTEKREKNLKGWQKAVKSTMYLSSLEQE
jgi:glycerol kinase